MECLDTRDEAECLALAAALERGLTHPIARAFANAPSRKIALDQRQVPGQGVSGIIDGAAYSIGAADTAADAGIETVVLLRQGETALARFTLATVPRPEAAQTLAQFVGAGIAVELLTGDSDAAALALARQLGIDEVRARQTPEQKLERLRELQAQGRTVLAVGDGINDAPFLAAADVSVAMPQGAALTQTRADLLLIGDSLAALPPARAVARLADRRVRQNIAWAIGYNLSVLPLAMAGVLLPWMAALGMSLSSLLVVANALRLRAAMPPDTAPEPRPPLAEAC